MKFAVGTDIVEVARVARLFERGGPRFTSHWFTDAEVAYCTTKAFPARHLAARIAAKESVLKAARWRWVGRASWPEIEVAHDVGGTPIIDVHGSIAELIRERGVHLAVSLAHEREWATATVIAWSVDPIADTQRPPTDPAVANRKPAGAPLRETGTGVVRDRLIEREAIEVTANPADTIA